MKQTRFRNFPRAALIDMDGTLYDSMGNHADAWLRVATEAGIEATRDEFFLYEGRTGASTIDILFNRQFGRNATDKEKKDLYHLKTIYFQQLPPVHPMPGAKKLLESLKHAGVKRVLVTGSGQNSLLSRIDTDFTGLMREDLRITSADVHRGKPDPEPYLKAIDMALTSAPYCVAFENAPLGVESAHRAGVFTVAITTGPIPAEKMWDAGADIVYNSMEECADLFPRLLYK